MNISEELEYFFDHHQCHAMYAYFLDINRKKIVLFVTADGG